MDPCRRLLSRSVVLLAAVALAGGAGGCGALQPRSADALAGPPTAVADDAGAAAARMDVPPDWSLYSEDHEDVPTIDGARIRNHTWRYAPDPEQPQAAAIALKVMEALDGAFPPGRTEAIAATEPTARLLTTSRRQPVTLMRDEARNAGLTYTAWAESDSVYVSVIARGDVSVDAVVAAVKQRPDRCGQVGRDARPARGACPRGAAGRGVPPRSGP